MSPAELLEHKHLLLDSMLKLTVNGAFCMINFLNTPFRGLGQKYPLSDSSSKHLTNF